MNKIAGNITELIGGTPLVELSNFSRLHGLRTALVAKPEYFNPGGSVKDRIALAMIEGAAARGELLPGATIVEPTSGNTGIGLAMVSAARGYKLILTMPETMSVERRKILSMLGAQIELTPGADGMKGAIRRAEELLREIPGSVMMSQFDNPDNPAAHERTTAQEVWDASGGAVDIFVGGVGTGGTISGVGRGLKKHNPAVQIVAVEPSSSPVLSGGAPGAHKIQGIGAGFVPGNFDAAVVDEVFAVDNDQAMTTAREIARTEGILVGISSGAAAFAALNIALRPENAGKRVVVLLPDTGERYISTQLFEI